jgi:hypothetical protein
MPFFVVSFAKNAPASIALRCRAFVAIIKEFWRDVRRRLLKSRESPHHEHQHGCLHGVFIAAEGTPGAER